MSPSNAEHHNLPSKRRKEVRKKVNNCYTISQMIKLRRARWLEKISHMNDNSAPRKHIVGLGSSQTPDPQENHNKRSDTDTPQPFKTTSTYHQIYANGYQWPRIMRDGRHIIMLKRTSELQTGHTSLPGTPTKNF
jgi:hypothetical protein